VKRLIKTVVALLVAFLCLAASASAHLMPQPDGLTVHVGDVKVDCGIEALACATPWTGEIWVASDSSRWSLAHEVGHVYLWRAFFTAVGARPEVPRPERAGQMAELKRMLGYGPETSWYAGDDYYDRASVDPDYASENAPPDERAADAYAACDLNDGPRVEWVRLPGRRKTRRIRIVVVKFTSYAYNPGTPFRHRRICDLMRSLA
jgi:hypothetical protein